LTYFDDLQKNYILKNKINYYIKNGAIIYDNNPNNIIVKPIKNPTFLMIFLALNFFFILFIQVFEIL